MGPLLLSLALQADAWIDRLGSDRLADREDAARRLLDLDRAAIPALEKAAQSDDAEIRGRAKDLLAEVARRERVRPFRPPARRLTLAVRDAPFYEAARQVFGPFGLSRFDAHVDLKDRRVTLALENASLWDAYEAFCRAGRAGIPAEVFLRSVSAEDLDFRDAAAGIPPAFRSDAGDVRIVADLDRSRPAEDGTPSNWVHLHAWLPAGHWANSVDVDGLRLTDEQGRDIPCPPRPGVLGSVTRNDGALTSVAAFAARIPSRTLQGAASLRLRGTLVLGYPHDVERVDLPLADLTLPRALKLGTSSYTIAQADVLSGRYAFGFRASCGGEALRILVALEDRDGRWILDASHDVLPAGSSSSGTGTRRFAADRTPARLVVWRILGEDRVRIPFAFPDLPVPALVPKD